MTLKKDLFTSAVFDNVYQEVFTRIFQKKYKIAELIFISQFMTNNFS